MGRDRKHRNSKRAFINPHIQDTTVPHTVQTVILPPTISVWVVQARAAWLVKKPMVIAKATCKLISFLSIYPPLANLQDKSIEAHRVSLKPFNMLKMSFKTTKSDA